MRDKLPPKETAAVLGSTPLADMVRNATTPTKRLAAITACFLTGKMPANFRYAMEKWGYGRTLRSLVDLEIKNVRHGCGTNGCIAGLANYLFGNLGDVGWATSGNAADLLGLGYLVKSKIFIPDDTNDSMYTELNDNPVQVGRVLTKYIRTGMVDWSEKTRHTPVRVAGRVF